MTAKGVSELWKTAATYLATVCISLAGAWVMIGKDAVTRAEVREMIVTEGPYVEDRKMILRQLEQNSENQKQLTNAIQDNTTMLAELKASIEHLWRRNGGPSGN